MHKYTLYAGDSLEVLKSLPDDSIEAVVTDPPYGLGQTTPAQVAECMLAWSQGLTWTPKGKGFMGKQWDAWVPPPELWREVLRVLKPGGHAIVFAGSRTQDLMSVSLRLAGFEVRDTLQWLYGSGFPKSLDISKALDKMAGAEREVIGTSRSGLHRASGVSVAWVSESTKDAPRLQDITAPATEPAQQWQGWGTALKPAYEPAILARKPLDGTVAQNTLAHGCGGLNIGGCRVAWSEGEQKGYTRPPSDTPRIAMQAPLGAMTTTGDAAGRWPANVLLDEGAAEVLDAQAPGASRFFYTAKASRAEREAGLEARDARKVKDGRASSIDNPYQRGDTLRLNTHPTVKPIALMRYLVKLVTPPNGTVLDPFTGSGSTGCAAALERVNFVGVELDPEYAEIARTRIAHWAQQGDAPQAPEPQEPEPPAPEPPAPEHLTHQHARIL